MMYCLVQAPIVLFTPFKILRMVSVYMTGGIPVQRYESACIWCFGETHK